MSDPPHSPGAPSEPASLILRMHTAGPDERIAILHDLLIRKATVCYTPDDLDRIAGLLDHEPRVVELALQILGNAAVKKGMLPADRSRFREKLRSVLHRFRSDGSQRAIIRSAVHLLGYLCDPAVLEQLAYDAERFDGDTVRREEYCHPAMAAVLKRHHGDLAALETAFWNSGNERAAQDISAIIGYASDPGAWHERQKRMQDEEVELL